MDFPLILLTGNTAMNKIEKHASKVRAGSNFYTNCSDPMDPLELQ